MVMGAIWLTRTRGYGGGGFRLSPVPMKAFAFLALLILAPFPGGCSDAEKLNAT